jgi:hypothetical protein
MLPGGNLLSWKLEFRLRSPPRQACASPRYVPFIGHRIESTYKITELEPDVQVSFESMSGPFPYHGNIFFEPVDLKNSLTKIDEYSKIGE